MLQIKNISKKYKTGELVQIALNDVSLNFRDNEFVSILGPSGSGKTTLLRLLNGEYDYEGEISVNGIKVTPKNIDEIRPFISVVFNEMKFLTDTVDEELKYSFVSDISLFV